MSKTMGMSRRAFLGMGAMTAAVAGAGLAGCAPKQAASSKEAESVSGGVPAVGSDWLGSAPEIAEDEIKETKETDLLIVGAGNGGMVAAATAVDLGVDFILAEQNDSVQSSRGWFAAVNSKYTKEAGAEVDPGMLLNELTRYASGNCDQRVIMTWINESAELVDWIDPILTAADYKCTVDTDVMGEMGGTTYFNAAIEHYYAGPDPAKRPDRNGVLEAYINEKGQNVSYGYKLAKLEREEGGKVTGTIFETKDGFVRVSAKNILLATGGYAGSADMIKALNPIVPQCVTLSYNAPANKGMGIKAAMWVGADRDNFGAPMIFDRGAVKPGEDAGYTEEGDDALFIGQGNQFNLGSQPFMKVTREGRRFCNESTPYDTCCIGAAKHPGGVWCQVFDSNLKEDVKRFNTIGCSRQTQGLLARNADAPIDEIYKDQLDAGTMVKADTVEELADKLGFEGDAKEAFLDQVDRYNTYFDEQHDAEFGKEPYRLSALRTAPFYGGWFGGSLLTTVDGLRINEDMQVLDTECKVIEGLFAAGDCSGSFYASNYPEYLAANACGRTMTESRHVVRLIAGDLEK